MKKKKVIKIENRKELLEDWQHKIDNFNAHLPSYIRLDVFVDRDRLMEFAKNNGYVPSGAVIVEEDEM